MSTYRSVPKSDTDAQQEWTLLNDLQQIHQTHALPSHKSPVSRHVQRRPLPEGSTITRDTKGDPIFMERSLLPMVNSEHIFNDHPRRREQPSLLSLWWLEISAMLLSLCALCAIFGLVYPYRILRPSPRWPSGITLNAAISVLSVVLRTGIVVTTAEALSQQKWIWFSKDRTLVDLFRFDQATRGPGGALVLLFRSSDVSFMGVFGAFIIIFAIALGPFAQQLVRFETCSLPSNTRNATAPRQGWAVKLANPTSETGIIRDTLGIAMRNSINGGLFAPQSNAVPIACSSRNCAFPQPYSTVGYCSSCEDLSSQVVVETQTYSYNESKTYTGVTYKLPGGLSLMHNGSVYTLGDEIVMKVQQSAQSQFDTYDLIQMRDPALRGINCTEEESLDPTLSWICRGYGAARCDLNPCVHTYSSSVIDGLVTETQLETQSVWGTTSLNNGTGSYMMLDLHCLGSDGRQAIKDQGYVFDDSDKWLAYNTSLGEDGYWSSWPEVRNPDIVSRCVYQINQAWIQSISTYTGSVVSGNTSRFYGRTTPAIRVLYNNSYPSFAHIDSVFRNISLGITSSMRQTANQTWGHTLSQNVTDIIFASNQPALGIVMEDQTCVVVRWGWLVFPAGMTLFTIVFLALTMIDTTLADSVRTSGQLTYDGEKNAMLRPAGIWKSSLLPLLFHGLDDKALRSSDPSRLVPQWEMERASRNVRARFTQNRDGWKIAKVD